MRARRLCLPLAALSSIALASAAAQAGQVVVMDQTWVHAPDLADSHYRVDPMVGTPNNWVSPIDYTQGSVWVYLEVHSKPTAQETRFQVCFEATPTYACTLQSPTYTEVGIVEWESKFSEFWSPPGEFVDWTLGVNKIACILKDTMNGKPSADNVGPDVAALYMPTEVRMVITVVEAGSEYVPPTPSGEETTGGDETTGTTGTDETTDASGTTSTSGTTAEPGTTEAPGTTSGEPGTTGDVTTGDDPTTGPTGETGATTSTTTTTGQAASDGSSDSGDSGCGCRNDARGGLGWLGALALLARRRRRA